MSLEEADAKFPGQQGQAIPPSPSKENPGQVYPKTDPKPAPHATVPGSGTHEEPTSTISNPFLLNSAYEKLDQALDDVIQLIEKEENSVGGAVKRDTPLEKLRRWRWELGVIRAEGMGNKMDRVKTKKTSGVGGSDLAQAGGLFAD